MSELDLLLDDIREKKDYSALWSKKAKTAAKKGKDSLIDLRDSFKQKEIDAACAYIGILKTHVILCDTGKTAKALMDQGCPLVVYTLTELMYLSKATGDTLDFIKEVHRIKKHFPCYIDSIVTIQPETV